MFIFSLWTVDKNTTPQPNSGVTTHLERGGGSITPSKMAEICFRKVQVKSMFWQDDCLRGMSQWHRLIKCWCNPLTWFGNCWQRIQTHRSKSWDTKKELRKGWSRKSIKIYCCNKDNMNEWKMEYSQNLFLDFCHFSISDANLLLNSISLSRAMDIGYIPLYEKISFDYCVEH